MLNFLRGLFLSFSLLIALSNCNRDDFNYKTSIEIYKDYEKKGMGTVFSVPPGLAAVFLDEDKAGNAELKDVLADVEKLTFLIVPNKENKKESITYSELDQKLDNVHFQNLAMINSGNEIVKIKVLHGELNTTREIVILVSNYENIFSVSFQGNINLEKVANLTQPENLEAVTHLNRFR